MKRLTTTLAAATAATLLISTQASAHSRFILPSHTSLSGEEATTIALDLSVSNDMFHPDFPLGGTPTENERGRAGESSVLVTAPDGSTFESAEIVRLGRKSATYVELEQSGTYKLTYGGGLQKNIFFRHADGSRGRASSMEEVPADATDVTRRIGKTVLETYVTFNDLTDTALEPTGEGLELAGGTHPNDLFVGEPIEFQFLLNGKPVAEGVEVTIQRGGTRHRNDREVINLTTDDRGQINFEFPQAGFYHLEMDVRFDSESGDYDEESYGYSATFEVWPE